MYIIEYNRLNGHGSVQYLTDREKLHNGHWRLHWSEYINDSLRFHTVDEAYSFLLPLVNVKWDFTDFWLTDWTTGFRIPVEDVEDRNKAYDRAMGVI